MSYICMYIYIYIVPLTFSTFSLAKSRCRVTAPPSSPAASGAPMEVTFIVV